MMNDWRKPCPEGRYEAHVDQLPCPGHFVDWPPGEQMSCTLRHELHCPGGSPVTAADLEGLGEKVWWCAVHETHHEPTEYCDLVQRLLIPIPDPVASHGGDMSSDELRAAVNCGFSKVCTAHRLIAREAARTIALPILERDEALVERLVVILRQGAQEYGGMEKLAFAVLAALIPTDTP